MLLTENAHFYAKTMKKNLDSRFLAGFRSDKGLDIVLGFVFEI